jgi:hypothetical protein
LVRLTWQDQPSAIKGKLNGTEHMPRVHRVAFAIHSMKIPSL